MKYILPAADILIHAGDFSRRGSIKEIQEFSMYYYFYRLLIKWFYR